MRSMLFLALFLSVTQSVPAAAAPVTCKGRLVGVMLWMPWTKAFEATAESEDAARAELYFACTEWTKMDANDPGNATACFELSEKASCAQ